MAIWAACGCSSGKRHDHRRSVSDSVSAGEQGAAAESDRGETDLPTRLIGRALRRQRSRWLRLTGSQRMRRVLLFSAAPLMLAFLPFVLGASSEDQSGPCPYDGAPTTETVAPTAESVAPLLEDCGTVEKLDLTDQLSIAVTIYAGDENHGGQVDLRRQMGRLMRGLHQVAQCFPAVKVIRADLLAPSENRHDEYGRALAGPKCRSSRWRSGPMICWRSGRILSGNRFRFTRLTGTSARSTSILATCGIASSRRKRRLAILSIRYEPRTCVRGHSIL
jgi:hypothetical protein